MTDAIGMPRPRLDFVLDDYTLKGAEAFERVADSIIERMSHGKQNKANVVDGFFGAGHVMGTHRMGSHARDSVTDSFGRSWDHPNLFLTGSGLFPTVDAANPTLTIAAVALRQADFPPPRAFARRLKSERARACESPGSIRTGRAPALHRPSARYARAMAILANHDRRIALAADTPLHALDARQGPHARPLRQSALGFAAPRASSSAAAAAGSSGSRRSA